MLGFVDSPFGNQRRAFSSGTKHISFDWSQGIRFDVRLILWHFLTTDISGDSSVQCKVFSVYLWSVGRSANYSLLVSSVSFGRQTKQSEMEISASLALKWDWRTWVESTCSRRLTNQRRGKWEESAGRSQREYRPHVCPWTSFQFSQSGKHPLL